MRSPEQARRDRALFQAKKIVERIARQRDTITYGELADEIEVMALPPNGTLLEGILTQISRQEDAQGRGLLSVVVINKKSGLPGDGFFALAKERGYEADGSQEEFFQRHREVVYDHHSPEPS